MNALRVAEGYCAINNQATILLCATEICSLHFQYGLQKNDLIANSLFADGSAALILNSASEGKIKYLGAKSFVIPNSQDALTWQIRDNGFIMTLSSRVTDLIQNYLPNFLGDWLKEYAFTLADIATWAVHPGGPKILSAVQTCLALPSSSLDVSRQVLAEYGNMSSPTVLFILERLLQAGHAAPSVMLGFGPGLTIEAALFV
jgi:predicted naringenin-chalcone synthase